MTASTRLVLVRVEVPLLNLVLDCFTPHQYLLEVTEPFEVTVTRVEYPAGDRAIFRVRGANLDAYGVTRRQHYSLPWTVWEKELQKDINNLTFVLTPLALLTNSKLVR